MVGGREARRDFAGRLRYRRIEAGFATARDFSRVINVHENTYTRWERGETEPSIAMIRTIARALDCDTGELIGE